MDRRRALLAAAILGLGSVLAAQVSPYSGLETRPIKALAPEVIAAYENGGGMGLALAAELNGYPGPKHVLELAANLGLSDGQASATLAVFEAMRSQAVRLGRDIVALERQLDHEFAGRSIDDETLSHLVARIADRQGELRRAHLAAHLRMAEVLDTRQRELYAELRGYGGGDSEAGHAHGPGHHGRH